MKTTKIIISVALANILLVAGIAYFPTLIENKVESETSTNEIIPSQNIQNTASTTANSTAPKPNQATTPSPATQPNPNQCVITISGVKYDVQPLRNTHSGGDVFVCNTDMTNIFFGEHDQSLLINEMQKYRLP